MEICKTIFQFTVSEYPDSFMPYHKENVMIKTIISVFSILNLWVSVASADTDYCTESDIRRMMESGYSSSEIYDTCGYIIEVKCCCECRLYVENAYFGSGEMQYDSTSHIWMDAYDCQTRTYYYWLIQKREAFRHCVPESVCGK